jgi:hypothetical protein
MMPSATTKTDLRLRGSEGRWAGRTIRAGSRPRSPVVFLPALLAAGLMSAGWTERATIEVTGAFHHRRPAMELVRQIVDERSAGRPYHHRLMDYNNAPTTRLADVRGIIADALSRLGHGGPEPRPVAE